MRRVATIIGQSCSICLLLFAAAIPQADCCGLYFLVEHHHEEKEGPAEEHRGRESVVQVSRRYRAEHRSSHGSRLQTHLDRLSDRSAIDQAQVWLADALRGAARFQNGCGAVLLR